MVSYILICGFYVSCNLFLNLFSTTRDKLFIPAGGARPSAKKILLVITDGESHDRDSLPYVASQAEAKNIVRFAIGVGFVKFLNICLLYSSVVRCFG